MTTTDAPIVCARAFASRDCPRGHDWIDGYPYHREDAPVPKLVPVRIVVQLDVDAAAWRAEYGDDESIAAIREAIKSAVHTAVSTDGIVVADVDSILTSIRTT